ncbi:MAG: hypothetical protein ACJ746_26160 [Bryobacteraceae bacterium]
MTHDNPLSGNEGSKEARLIPGIVDRAVAEDAGCHVSPQSAQSERRICSLQIRPPLKQHKYPMTWLPLDSQMFLSVAYDATQRILYLRFRSGDVYR